MDHETNGIDNEIASIAASQHGVVAHGQLVDAGLGTAAIQRRVRRGWLHRVHKTVYAVGQPRITLHGRWSAAELHGICRASGPYPHVTAPGRCRGGHPRLILHLPRRLHEEDVSKKGGIPVTSVARTLLDYSEAASRPKLDRAIEEAERREIFDLAAVERLIERGIGRRGRRRLSDAVSAYRPAPFTRSELERAFLELCRDARIPPPAANVFLAGAEVDMAWPEHRLVVELDGHEFHRTRAAFERDRVRDAGLQLAGYRVLRVTDRRLRTAPAEVAAAVRALLV